MINLLAQVGESKIKNLPIDATGTPEVGSVIYRALTISVGLALMVALGFLVWGFAGFLMAGTDDMKIMASKRRLAISAIFVSILLAIFVFLSVIPQDWITKFFNWI